MNAMTRRSAGVLVFGLAMTLTLTGCAQNAPGTESSGGASTDSDGSPAGEVRFAWWGNDVRHTNTLDAIALFEDEHPEITIVPEYGAYDGYWEKFNTQVAGGNPVDLVTITTNQLAIQAQNGVLQDLSESPYLDLSAFSQETLDNGTLDGGLYGLDIASNMHVWILNGAVIEASGVPLPDVTGWSWDEYREFAQAISDAGQGEYYGASDHGGRYEVFETTLEGEGKGLFSEDGGLGYTKDDLRAWWAMWDEMRQSGAAAPATVTAGEDFSAENSATLSGQTAGAFIFSPMFEGWQAATDDELILASVPGGQSYNKVSMYYGIVADGQNPDAAAVFMDWLVNSPEAGELIGIERGVPTNPEVLEAVLPSIGPDAQRVVEFMGELEEDGLVGPTPRLQPAGADEVNTHLFRRMYEEIAFGNMTIDQAVDSFFEQAQEILERNVRD